MRGSSVIQGFCKYNPSAMNRNKMFQISDNNFAMKGCIYRIALWINKNCIAQAWETDAEKLRLRAKRMRAKYVIRDMHGKALEYGDYSREGGK